MVLNFFSSTALGMDLSLFLYWKSHFLFFFIAKINDTVNFGEEEEDDNIIEFDEVSGDEDIENVSNFKIHFECLMFKKASLPEF